jgi:hypothetical protein
MCFSTNICTAISPCGGGGDAGEIGLFFGGIIAPKNREKWKKIDRALILLERKN